MGEVKARAFSFHSAHSHIIRKGEKDEKRSEIRQFFAEISPNQLQIPLRPGLLFLFAWHGIDADDALC